MSANDKIKNEMDDATGKAKQALGRATGDKSTETEGKAQQSAADLRKAGQKAKDAVEH